MAKCCHAGAYAAWVIIQQSGCSCPAKSEFDWAAPAPGPLGAPSSGGYPAGGGTNGGADQLISGTAIAKLVRAELKEKTDALVAKYGVTPGLAVVLVGNRPDSATYVRNKSKACQEVGITVVDKKFDETVSQEELLKCVEELNADPKVHGILVQLPLPKHIDEQAIVGAIAVKKDADGFSAYNIGSLALKGGDPWALPCTPAGCMELLRRSGVEVSGKKCVVLGRSNIVGMPVALMLIHANGTVSVCHSRTQDIPAQCREADIVIAAIGKAKFVQGSWLKPGCVVIDVGINAVDDPGSAKGYKLVGDVDFEAAKSKAAKITPVPGGVGPMTIAMLLRNTYNLAERVALAGK